MTIIDSIASTAPKRLLLAVGILICAIVVLVTLVFQLEHWIDVLTNLTDLWIFGVVFPLGSLGAGLIGVGLGLSRKKTSAEKLMTEPVPTIQSPLTQSVEIFKVGLLPDKRIFHKGEFLLFTMRFKGILREGYRATYATFSNKKGEGIYDYRTLPDIYAKGTLDGLVDFDEQWPWRVPLDAPIGRCELFIAPCTLTKDVMLHLKLWRTWLHFRNPRRIDLAKPERQAVRGETIVVELVD